MRSYEYLAALLVTACSVAGRPLRLLSLGDSITYGCGNSADDNPLSCVPRSNCSDTCCAGSPDAGPDIPVPPVPGCQAAGMGPGRCPYTGCPDCGGGASGAGSGSYRAPLRALLEGWRPGRTRFVGSRRGGGTRHMGYPGWRADQLYNMPIT